MIKSPFFSIIVPCYNQAQYLEETINSVLNQTFKDWECIIVNDGSSDNTEDIAKAISEKDNRITYLKKENGGVSSARNFGINYASGIWILPLDGDDKISNLYLEHAYDIIKNQPDIKLVYAKACFFGEKNESWLLPKFDYRKLLTANLIYCSAFYRKEDWAKIGGYDNKMIYGFEDWEFWINLLKAETSESVYCIDSIDFYYRYKECSRDRDILKNQEQKKMMYDYIFNKHINLYVNIFGVYQELAYNYLEVENKLNYLNGLVNHNILTRFFYKIIRFLN